MGDPRPVTIRDIAVRAGVTPTTVSKALRGTDRIAEATRKRIIALAEEMGYRRDPALAALAEYRHGREPRHQRLGLFRCRTFAAGGRHADLWGTCCAHGERLGYALEAVDVEDLIEDSAFDPGAWCDDRGIAAGLVVAQSWEPTWRIRIGRSRPVVMIGDGPADGPVTRIVTDAFGDMQRTCRQLRAFGHLRIGLILSRRTDGNSGGRWSAAFLGLQHAATIDDDPALWLSGDDTIHDLRDWLRVSRPEAVITVHGGAWRRLTELRRDLPASSVRAVARVGWHRDPPEGPGIVDDLARLGESAIDQIDLALRRRRRGPTDDQRISLPGRWVDGVGLIGDR